MTGSIFSKRRVELPEDDETYINPLCRFINSVKRHAPCHDNKCIYAPYLPSSLRFLLLGMLIGFILFYKPAIDERADQLRSAARPGTDPEFAFYCVIAPTIAPATSGCAFKFTSICFHGPSCRNRRIRLILQSPEPAALRTAPHRRPSPQPVSEWHWPVDIRASKPPTNPHPRGHNAAPVAHAYGAADRKPTIAINNIATAEVFSLHRAGPASSGH